MRVSQDEHGMCDEFLALIVELGVGVDGIMRVEGARAEAQSELVSRVSSRTDSKRDR